MKIAFYPGSFNPWHQGHGDILEKALKVFDKIVILQMSNSSKTNSKELTVGDVLNYAHNVIAPSQLEILHRPDQSIITAIGNHLFSLEGKHDYAIIRGMRNEKDFCDEQILTYWYEDLGVKMPIFHIISDRKLVHVSSSAIKAANKFTE